MVDSSRRPATCFGPAVLRFARYHGYRHSLDSPALGWCENREIVKDKARGELSMGTFLLALHNL